jgi:hypothetical protein
MKSVELIFSREIPIGHFADILTTVGRVEINGEYLYIISGCNHVYLGINSHWSNEMEDADIWIFELIPKPAFFTLRVADNTLAWRVIEELAKTLEFYIWNEESWFATPAEYSSWVDWCEIFGEDWVRSKPSSDSDGIFLVPPSRVETDVSDTPPS